MHWDALSVHLQQDGATTWLKSRERYDADGAVPVYLANSRPNSDCLSPDMMTMKMMMTISIYFLNANFLTDIFFHLQIPSATNATIIPIPVHVHYLFPSSRHTMEARGADRHSCGALFISNACPRGPPYTRYRLQWRRQTKLKLGKRDLIYLLSCLWMANVSKGLWDLCTRNLVCALDWNDMWG